MKRSKLSPTPAIERAHASAVKVRKNAHAPYSKFQVGATLLSADGETFDGCNVENASYGGTICAERVAILKAVSNGTKSFSDIVIVTDAPVPAYPCAFCLQVMAEFFAPETQIWIADTRSIRGVHRFVELLPKPFGPAQLREGKAKAPAQKGSRKQSQKRPEKN